MASQRDDARNRTPLSGEPLTKRVVRGSLWAFSLRVANRGLGFVRTVILARLLSPADFGLLGIAMLAASVLDHFSQTGFQTAIIQKKDHVDPCLDTAWTVSALRGLMLSLILFFSAPSVAAFFHSPPAVAIIQIVAISMLLTGFRNIGTLFFQKELTFDKQFIFELAATVVDLLVSITLAFILRDVWALVWGGLAGNVTRLVLSYMLHPYRPHVRIDRHALKELSGFGGWVFISSILIFIMTQGSDILVGKMLGLTALGLYQMAFLLAYLSASEIAVVIAHVTFPAFSEIQQDLPRLRAAYLSVLQLTAFIAIPVGTGILILIPEFTVLFLGSKWTGIIDTVRILCVAGIFGSITASMLPVFFGMGIPKTDTTWQIARLATLGILIYPLAVRWDIAGVAIAMTCAIMIQTLGLSLSLIKTIQCRFISFFRMIMFPVLNSAMMMAVVALLKHQIGVIGIFTFVCLVVCGILTYAAGTVLLDHFFNYGIRDMIRKRIFA